MHTNQRLLHEMLERVNAFGSAHAKDFPAGTIGHQMFATVGGCVRDVVARRPGTRQTSPRGARVESAGPKVLWAFAAIRRTARAIAFDAPGFDRPFRLPRGNGAPRLIVASRVLETAASKSAAEFIAHGLPQTFLDDLAGRIDGLERAVRASRDSRFARRSAVTGIKASLKAGLRAVQRLDAVVPNVLGTDSAAMAAWRRARRVERPVRRRTDAREAGAGSAVSESPERRQARLTVHLFDPPRRHAGPVAHGLCGPRCGLVVVT